MRCPPYNSIKRTERGAHKFGADAEKLMSRAHIPFAKSNVGVRALQSIDIAVRHAESFAAMQDEIA